MAELIFQDRKLQDTKNDTLSPTKSAAVLRDNRGQVSQARALPDMRTTQLQQNSTPKPNDTGLPNQLKAGIESLSGMSMDHVKVHYNSSQPAQLNAHAYAQGSDIHVASGQEKHLPHEAWHVVQQAQGRVKPTMQLKAGGGVNDDVRLEREADVMGGKALENGAKTVQLVENQSRLTRFTVMEGKPLRGATVQMHRSSNVGMLALPPSPLKAGQLQLSPVSGGTPPPGTPVQRYLIVQNHDYTDDVNVQGQTLVGVTGTVFTQILLDMGPANFPAPSLENTMFLFLQANVGNLVTRQLSKWIEDMQGQPGAKSHPDFGRKQQARIYGNYVDLGRALYGWVSAKAGRREEKHLANQVYASPVIDAQINSVLAKLKLFVDGHASTGAIVADLSVNNPAPVFAHWADYRNWFNHMQPGAGRAIPGNYYAVLTNPATHTLRAKIAVLHDIMNYLMQQGHLAALPGLNATTPLGRAPYVRPASSVLVRDSVARVGIPDVVNARVHGHVRTANDEQHNTYTYARTHNIPMWGRHSYTAARMMTLTQQVGGTNAETGAVADSIMAFWRKDYDHRSIAYHTLHEIQDFTPDFGLGAYNPLTRYDDTHNRLDVLPTLMIRLGVIANSVNWNSRGFRIRGPNTTPASIVAIRTELGTAHTDVDKLSAIKTEIHNKVGISPSRDRVTKNFYIILNEIPDNILSYSVGATARATKSAIALRLSRILRELNAFVP